MKKLLQTLHRYSLAIVIGIFIIGTGLIILTWHDTYKAPLWGEVEVYVDRSYRKVDEIEVYVNLGRTKITYSKYDETQERYIKHTIWVNTKDIQSVVLMHADSSTWSSWDRMYGEK